MKLLITSVPWTDTKSPLMAPALLKSMCTDAGIDAKGIDLNQVVINYVRSKYSEQAQQNIQHFFYYAPKTFQKDAVVDVINFIVDQITQYNPTHVALSLLAYTSQVATEWICFALRLKAPHIKIIIGGAGVFNTLESTTNFGEKLLTQKQIDYYIKGDGDISLPKLLIEDNKVSGVNETQWTQMPDLNNQPVPDYDDYDWSIYKNKSIGVVGSRGCVRHCTFCDIHEHWKKFQFRKGEDLFAELMWHNKRNNIQNFKFQDSLINGNQKEFRKLMILLANHNDANPDNLIKWSSFFIFRPEKQMNEDDWMNIGKSCDLLTVGIESINEKVRFEMGKKFTNEDMNYCFDMCKKYNIKVQMLLIVGYVSDTEETHKETVQWFANHKHYIDSPISGVSLGGTLGILPGTEIYRRREELGIELKDQQFDHDFYIKDTDNTPTTRLRWHKEQTEACMAAGYRVTSLIDNHLLMEQMME